MAQAIPDSNCVLHGEQEQGAKQYQEDSFCTFCSPDQTLIMAAIFDGHGGLNGRIASTTAIDITKRYFVEHWQECLKFDNNQWELTLKNLFKELHESVRSAFVELEQQRNRRGGNHLVDEKGVVRRSNGYPVHGGSTASVVIVTRTDNTYWRVICANSGDSDSLLLARKPSRLKSTNTKCKHLSVDHSPDNAMEYMRLKDLPKDKFPKKLMFVYDLANVCRKYECPVVFLEDGTKDPQYVKNPWGNSLRPTNVRYDPAVYAVSPCGVNHDVTCIAMTRSLGDFYAHQFGLTWEPDVQFEKLDMNKEFIITVGSDGIWDCWKWDEFTDYVNGVMTKCGDRIPLAVRTVLRNTVARAKACFGESAYDDATLIMISLRRDLYPPIEESQSQSSSNSENAIDRLLRTKSNSQEQEKSHSGKAKISKKLSLRNLTGRRSQNSPNSSQNGHK